MFANPGNILLGLAILAVVGLLMYWAFKLLWRVATWGTGRLSIFGGLVLIVVGWLIVKYGFWLCLLAILCIAAGLL